MADPGRRKKRSGRAGGDRTFDECSGDRDGQIENVAFVISSSGEILGRQTKNQLDPAEDRIFVSGVTRKVFRTAGVTFGIAICHEGFRYSESVRWAVRRGASIVFLPYCAGSNREGRRPTEWRGVGNTFHEHAMVCRAVENDIYVAGVNYAFAFQDAATCVVAPNGDCAADQPYGEAGVLVVDVDTDMATRRLANRYNALVYEGETPAGDDD